MSGSPKSEQFAFSFSIRAKLILINLTLLVSVGLYAYYEQISFNNLKSLENAAIDNLQSSVDLLMLRRHEKDFLARKDMKYPQRFDKTFEELSERLTALTAVLKSHNLDMEERTSTIISTLNQYQVQFHQLVDQVNTIEGVESSSNLISELEQARKALKVAAADKDSFALEVELLELMEADYRYLANTDKETSAALLAAIDKFSTSKHVPVDLQPVFNQYQRNAEKLVEACEVLGLTSSDGVRGALRSNVHNTEKAINGLQTEISQVISQKSSDIKNKLFLIGGAIVVLLSSMLLLIGRTILSRIQAINTLMENIASGDGDLTVRMNAKGDDELAQLANSFDRFISQLHGHIKELANVMTVLSESSCSSEHAAAKSMNNAEQQKIQSESVATAVNELVMTSNEITANIESAAQNAESMKYEADSALKVTHSTSESIQTLSSNIEDSQNLIEDLAEQSKEINQVIATIQGIAEQTNLLALNAAIEAARAGENGRGFAVVADEVRQLSLMTNNSTHQIETTIQTLTSGIQQTVAKMSTSLEQAHRTNASTKDVVKAIDNMALRINEMSDMNTQIATASEEQSMVSADIDRNITEIAHLAGDTHKVVAGSVRCSEQVSGVSHKLEQIVANFKY
ncbi:MULTISPECIES: methyl-accepting chemotaxis protein [Vibrio]|uniref:methyl-accepting chemotaxis protein n=1 Tax=Vibrio TaxID=662 RepID=UPI0020764E9B|nr:MULTISPECIES: methyl-accepting chemotaxis protein [Vibrio]USD31216.1 methyl-accepting chemotaxis protein [Vibrio sp. SCSIO 43186]USD44261.1 methyl-accepting chemotaxis protein [Vibrio sp. SCSIO 43145]USD68339.1 methyl-accepting chemotaxis protein [Vibrio sp. SCSIO 43139]USD96021.1 methyl-accepting chemotaxis protein [Vibrio coralliilyticus]